MSSAARIRRAGGVRAGLARASGMHAAMHRLCIRDDRGFLGLLIRTGFESRAKQRLPGVLAIERDAVWARGLPQSGGMSTSGKKQRGWGSVSTVKSAPGVRDRNAGLTLIEMLMVLVIIGIATSALVLGTNLAGRDRRVETEAVRLAARLEMAVDEGLVARVPLALFWTAGGYEFRRWDGSGWQVTASAGLAAHALPAALVLRRQDGESGPVVVAEDGLGAAVALEISGAGAVWRVAFDGFSSDAARGVAP